MAGVTALRLYRIGSRLFLRLPSSFLPASRRKKFQLGFRLANGFVDIQEGNRLETGKRCAARLFHAR